MGTPPVVALWLGLAALPVCLWASYVDLSRLKIPNRSYSCKKRANNRRPRYSFTPLWSNQK